MGFHNINVHVLKKGSYKSLSLDMDYIVRRICNSFRWQTLLHDLEIYYKYFIII